MEAYRVITKNLDWYGLYEGTVIELRGETVDNDYWEFLKDSQSRMSEATVITGLRKIIDTHPDWFERIGDQAKENWYFDFSNNIVSNGLKLTGFTLDDVSRIANENECVIRFYKTI